MRYVWDPTKARANRKKHGIPFEEAVTSFADPLAIIVDDDAHPERALLIGMSFTERVLVTFPTMVVEIVPTRDDQDYMTGAVFRRAA